MKTEYNLGKRSFYKMIKTLLQESERSRIFLRSNTSLGYPNREIEVLRRNEFMDKNLAHDTFSNEVEVNFMGLQGSCSQLPGYILDKLAKNNDGNEGWSLLLDFFNNYILWLFYDIVSIRNFARSFQADFDDKISGILLSLLGISDKKIAQTYLSFAPLIANLRRPKKQIERVLQITLNLHDRLSIIENVPHQIPINSGQKNYLGVKNSKLGSSFIVGDKVISYQTKIGILIEKIHYREATSFFPTGAKFKLLKESVTFLTNNEFTIDLYLKIDRSEEMVLKTSKNGVKLGWGSALGQSSGAPYLMTLSLC